jgi:flagellar basal-body rod protein FlgB
MAGLYNSNFTTISMAMDVASLRNEVYAHNIANAETPGYKRREVSFEEEFKKVLGSDDLRLKTSRESHIQNYPVSFDDIDPDVSKITNTYITNDGNNVDIDKEMAMVSANALRYQTLSRLMDQNFIRYNIVLKGLR